MVSNIKLTKIHFGILGILILFVILFGILYLYKKRQSKVKVVKYTSVKKIPSPKSDKINMNLNVEKVPIGAETKQMSSKNGEMNDTIIESFEGEDEFVDEDEFVEGEGEFVDEDEFYDEEDDFFNNKFLTTKKKNKTYISNKEIKALTCIENILIILNILKESKKQNKDVNLNIKDINSEIKNFSNKAYNQLGISNKNDTSLKSIVEIDQIPPKTLRKIYRKLIDHKDRSLILPRPCSNTKFNYEQYVFDLVQNLPREFRNGLLIKANQIKNTRIGFINKLIMENSIRNTNRRQVRRARRMGRREKLNNAEIWQNDYSSICPKGCAYVGKYSVGCVDPSFGPDSCIFARECTDCIK